MGKINYRTDDINKKLKQIDELVGSNNNLSNQINNFNSQLDTIAITMPPPSTVDINTKNLQNILDKSKKKNINLTVQFLGG